NRFGGSNPGLQASPRRARPGAARFSASRRRRVVVGQAFEYFEAAAPRTGSRGASSDAPNEKRRPRLSRSKFGCCCAALLSFAFWINDERVSRGEFAPFVIHHRSVFSRDFRIRIGKQFEIESFLRAKILVRLRSVDAHAKDHCVCLLIFREVTLEIAGFQRAT